MERVYVHNFQEPTVRERCEFDELQRICSLIRDGGEWMVFEVEGGLESWKEVKEMR
jgi:hypothetical protein